MLKTKEHVLHYLTKGIVSLSKYDARFVTNLTSIIRGQGQITSNQQALFEKIILKYRRQFTKNSLDVDELAKLPWTTQVVESTVEHTSAFIKIENNKIVVKVPFNRRFINYFRTAFDASERFFWIKDRKNYEAIFSTNSLKAATKILPDFFTVVNFSPEVSEILETVNNANAKIWRPTLTKINGNNYILGANEPLLNAISHIELNDDPKTLFELSLHGVLADDTILGDDLVKRFASNFNYILDLDNVEEASHWMKQLGITDVLLFIRDTNIRQEVKNILNSLSINTITHTSEMKSGQAYMTIAYGPASYEHEDVLHHKGTAGVNKNILLTNSRPVILS